MPIGARTIDLTEFLGPDVFASQLADRFNEWDTFRQSWIAEKREIRNYLFATDIYGTTNASLPWKNSTHVPKLTQIRDNLHANYMAALFPNDKPIVWEGDDESAEAKTKRQVIESYMANKLRMSGFRTEVSKCVQDYIDYGNCFGTVEFVAESTLDPTTQEQIPGYVGPKFVRISPLDIVFNPIAASFAESPKIVRSIKTLGSIKAELEDHPERGYESGVFDRMQEVRKQLTGMSISDFAKTEGFQIDGFSSFFNYFEGDYVEILDFYGDFFDKETGVLYKNYMISVVDRSFILRKQPNPSWLGTSAIHHAGWRQRPDNLYAMGPLDNLVGMQYRIDHLENAKADGFDLIVHPVTKVKGFVEDFDYGPGERIYMGEEGDVEFMRPDVTMLNADTQVAMYEQKMEEMAGAPKQAMGFRTPGEKTAYEVQILENGSNRIFINKTAYLEEIFLEPILNTMLETARRNMGVSDVVRVVDDQFGVVSFLTVTREDIAAKGKIRPMGARHFARNATIIQNLTQFANSPIGQDPAVLAHVSGKKMAYLFEQLFGLERYQLVQDNIRIMEQFETQKLAESAKNMLMEQNAPTGPIQPTAQPQPSGQVAPSGPGPQGTPGTGTNSPR